MGRAKFGIFGDGKEVPQLVMARHFAVGDWRAGYYRDQTLLMALGVLTPQQFFAQLYAHSDFVHEPASSGRMMTAHFGTPLVDEKGEWLVATKRMNSSADISPTAGQLPRLLGLAYASKLYRNVSVLQRKQATIFSDKGNEVAWGTIGDASTSEGLFFEVLQAAGVLQVPMLLSVWDDGYGISVPAAYQSIKESISEAVSGFMHSKQGKGVHIYQVKGWDYEALCNVYQEAALMARKLHVPVLVHVQELTQPQGHSTSGAHTRYKSKARLAWEKAHDCLTRMRQWILEKNFASEQVLDTLEQRAKMDVKVARNAAWEAFVADAKKDTVQGMEHLNALCVSMSHQPVGEALQRLSDGLAAEQPALRSNMCTTLRQALYVTCALPSKARTELQTYCQAYEAGCRTRYSTHLYSQSSQATTLVQEVLPRYGTNSKEVDGREVLQACFDGLLTREPRFFAIGEDVGKIGDVNQAFAGLQQKHGLWRVTDTGIREASIVGQGIGAALRGLRPLVEIQYLDYMLYALHTLSDDLATLHYRTAGRQKAPLIVRTRGHRLEGIWHSGSPMGTLLHALRGMHVLVPRDMTRAAAFYNTLLAGDEPALLIECLNGYRLKEKMPANVTSMRLALGKPEILRTGNDITILTYGAMCRICLQAAEQLATMRVDVEVIDLQTLLPFDTHGITKTSLAKTNRLLIADEDVPGGANAYILQQVLDTQQGYYHLDTPPRILSAQPHRPAYGSDGNYFSKPNKEDVLEAAYALMAADDPKTYPPIYP